MVQSWLGGVAVSAALVFWSPLAGAQSVERLGPAEDWTSPVLGAPAQTGTGTAGWADRVQLVYIAKQRGLERRAYRAWRSELEAGLTFAWTPDDLTADRAGPVTGRGQMVWRDPGAASYSADGVVAVYSGTMQGGKRWGEGRYRHRSGFAYDGAWHDGMMHGTGTVALANGDHYAGSFRGGRLHGFGRYITSEGIVYEGWFENGKRHGDGLVRRPDAGAYAATWNNGVETAGTRRTIAAPRLHLAGLDDDFRVSVTVDATSSPTETSFEYETLSETASLYRTAAEGETLAILPASQRIMNVWRARTPIQLIEGEELHADNGGGFLGIYPEDIKPVSVVFAFENRSRQPVRIVDAALEVAESVTDREPMVQIARGVDDSCNVTRPVFDPAFRLENFGWSPVENGILSVQFQDGDGRKVGPPLVKTVPPVQGSENIDFQSDLGGMGLNIPRLKQGFVCPAPADYSDAAQQAANRVCLASLRETGAFGPLASAIELGAGRVQIDLAGQLSHNWTDQAGRTHSRDAVFETRLSLGKVTFEQAECGEGGDLEDLRAKPFKFRLDEKDYRLRVGIRDTVPAGVTARWRMRLEADRSSRNLFRLAFSLSDGSVVRSRPVDLLYFKPRER